MILKNLFQDSTLSESFIAKHLEYEPFLVQLLAYYISERYPSYREKLSNTISREKAEEVLEKTEEVFQWLRSLTE